MRDGSNFRRKTKQLKNSQVLCNIYKTYKYESCSNRSGSYDYFDKEIAIARMGPVT